MERGQLRLEAKAVVAADSERLATLSTCKRILSTDWGSTKQDSAVVHVLETLAASAREQRAGAAMGVEAARRVLESFGETPMTIGPEASLARETSINQAASLEDAVRVAAHDPGFANALRSAVDQKALGTEGAAAVAAVLPTSSPSHGNEVSATVAER